MSEQAEISRRAVLVRGAGLAGVTVLTLAGCGTGGATSDAVRTEAPSSAANSTSPTAPSATRSTAAQVHPAGTTTHDSTRHSPSHSAPADSTSHSTPHSTPHSTQHSTHDSTAPASSRPSAAPSARRTSSSAAPPAGALAKVSAIPVGGSIAATQAGKPITLARPSAGTVVAFSAICTHMGCTVNAGGPQLNCPCHGSVFNAFTGQVLNGPAPNPLPSVAVHVADGYVVSG
ncbi:MAG TPA: Rieske 2Fe-2S domain-containing protein [Jatrophihabitans sp.]|nr:Rieske 2Fe-2S domain-containing protein [Jatrophihabitans sp.]